LAQIPQIETKNYVVRYITPPMVTERWVKWTTDNFLMGQINSKTLNLSKVDIQRYVVSAIKNRRSIFGIFRKLDFDHIGLYELMNDQQHRVVNLDVLVDIPKYDLHTVMTETDPVLLSYLNKNFGVEKAVASVPATFSAAIKHYEKDKWLREGVLREELPALKPNRRVDAIQFGKLLGST
jgi:hypothetical protein